MIHKAQVKKQYYKDLKAEGYGDGGVLANGTGSNGGALGERDDDAEQDSDDSSDGGEEDDPQASVHVPAAAKGKARAAPPSRPAKPSATSRPTPKPTPAPAPVAVPAPVKRPRLSEPEIKQLRDKKKVDRQGWVQRGARGQPKLGSRVEMLLGRIKKNMA